VLLFLVFTWVGFSTQDVRGEMKGNGRYIKGRERKGFANSQNDEMGVLNRMVHDIKHARIANTLVKICLSFVTILSITKLVFIVNFKICNDR
jgi:hypothetical protein